MGIAEGRGVSVASRCPACSQTLQPLDIPRIDVEASERFRSALIATETATDLDRLLTLLDECRALAEKKNKDYGRSGDPFANVKASSEFGVAPWVGAMIRLNDKVRRLQALANGSELANEGARDSFMDIAVYALIACVLYEDHVE